MPAEAAPSPHPWASIAALTSRALGEARELLILVDGDAVLPEISEALDLSIRPLCLILPQADFAAGTAIRATLSLLKSRLWRDGDELDSRPWRAQKERLARIAPLWNSARDWIARQTISFDPPDEYASLFPVLILPFAAWRKALSKPGALVLLYQCSEPPEFDMPDGAMLHVGIAPPASDSRALAPAEETTRLLLERSRLTQDIADLELELASVQAELSEFRTEYYRRVGSLMAEHDALRARQAECDAAAKMHDAPLRAEAAARRRQAEQSAAESERFANATPDETQQVSRPDNETKRLFRRLAQQIHPDRALTEPDRAWRTQLMSEANRAYRHGDIASLREIATLWQEQPAPHRAQGPSGVDVLMAQLQRLRARLAGIEKELHALFGSRLYELFIATRQAARSGRDLLDEMASQIGAEIAALRASSPLV